VTTAYLATAAGQGEARKTNPKTGNPKSETNLNDQKSKSPMRLNHSYFMFSSLFRISSLLIWIFHWRIGALLAGEYPLEWVLRKT
jgi:hypothetical protein